MKIRKAIIKLLLTCSIALGGIITLQSPIRAAVHTTPVSMRGTWYGYSKSYGFWEKIHVTKHTFSYSSSGSHSTLAGKNLSVFSGKTGHHKWVTFQLTGHAAATDIYWHGKAKVNGHYRKCLIQNGDTAMFHSKVKHYSIPKYYR
ncbi:hypothetical protein [Lentilactobacillus hilgardii]|uniref:hypothetical protein n=1 Tax=Lentilactobacillus hilgardii TaxID=1588 RepID=UPI0039EC2D3B